MSTKEEQSETKYTDKRKRDGYPSTQDNREQKQMKIQEADNNIEKVMKKASCPLFLKKTYCMVNTCDQDIVRWSSDGSYFIINNPMRFTTDIIPRYFKHNNLQSFARQLNLYGFRKIKTDPENAISSDEHKAKYLCFRHSQFIRDRPDLLFKIRKPSSKGPSVQQEIDSLKSEVTDLNSIVSKMANKIESLDSLLRQSSVLGDLDTKLESNESTDNVFHGQNTASQSATNQMYTSQHSTNGASVANVAVNTNHMFNVEYNIKQNKPQDKKVAAVTERLQIPHSATQSPVNIITQPCFDQIFTSYGFPCVTNTKEDMDMNDDSETLNTDVFSFGSDEAEDELNQFP